MIAKKWIRQNEFQGMPKMADFKLVKETLPDTLGDRGNSVHPALLLIYCATVLPMYQ